MSQIGLIPYDGEVYAGYARQQVSYQFSKEFLSGYF